MVSGAGRPRWEVTAALALVYAVAVVLGRRTVLEGTEVSLVSPAAAVGILWWAIVSPRRVPWPDLGVLAVLTWVLAVLTGLPPVEGVVLTLATVVQVAVTSRLLLGQAPRLWRQLWSRPLAQAEDVWWLVAAGIAGALASAPLVPLAFVLGGTPWTWSVVGLWIVRNVVGLVVVVPLVAGLGTRAWTRGPGGLPVVSRTTPDPRAGRPLETFAALVVAPVAYAVWFVGLSDLPVAFPLIALTVWAGARLPTRTVVAHVTVLAVIAVAFTLVDLGPFANVGSVTEQAVISQLYVGIVCVIGLSLALARDERSRLLAEAARARDAALTQAELLTTIVDTMGEGVSVVDADGTVLLRNPAAGRLLGAEHGPRAVGAPANRGLTHLDGTAVRDEELPHALAREGRRVVDQRLLVPDETVPGGRVLSLTSSPLPGRESGVVTVLRDVTADHRERAHAAQVQAALLPATPPRVEGYELAGRAVTARSVGGDFYDWRAVPGGVLVTLGDVMGKGTGAALLAATARATLRTTRERDPVPAVDEAERLLVGDFEAAGAFVTVLHVRLDAATGLLRVADAGHGLALVVRADGTRVHLPSGGAPLGLGDGRPRDESLVTLSPGDLFVAFSDGVLDALGGTRSAVEEVAAALVGASSARAAVDVVVALTGDAQPEDDVTVVALRRD